MRRRQPSWMLPEELRMIWNEQALVSGVFVDSIELTNTGPKTNHILSSMAHILLIFVISLDESNGKSSKVM